MTADRKIIVITPIKNEEWILETFLKITLQYADHVLLADQYSTDNSVEIASKFANVDVIINDSKDYDEAYRQKLLINTARERYGKGNIILAIDSDELLNYDALKSEDWSKMQQAKPGTVLYFEKPTYFNGTEQVIRYEKSGGWPLGFIDDDSEHFPKHIHSARVPIRANSPKLFLKDVKFLHCNLLSLKRQRSKIRYYCLIEAEGKTKKWHQRVWQYNKDYDYSKEGNGLGIADYKWVDGWKENNISIIPEREERFYWYDLEALKMLEKAKKTYGYWLEDVWDINWKEVGKHFNYKIKNINVPSKLFLFFRQGLYKMIYVFVAIKRKL
ncbi:Glycosyl transferase family 2 [Flaviramulus basaltis]|uniref:Glycosyl transferase family 2 n=1 Tax=Flaviramulus basaltis TaxID=369401 RepID=A0A1K2IP88_9FLAO|nr:glycosyltransferase family 2 protein [Flaviramulus basaltis]SFZ94016.1 Glycosyl transferase family 2 [Flaviramulus basaltis]